MSVTLNNYGKMANMNTAEFYGKSTDEKPTEQNGGNIINGSIYVEIDTGRAYFYDAEMKMWTPVTPPSADGTYTKEQIDALLNKKMSYYIVTVEGNKIVHEGETLTYAKIQQLYEDESVFIYMEHAGLTLIPSVDVDNSIIAFSSDWMRKEGTGYEPFIYVVQITSDNTVTSQQFQIEDVANKITVINGRNATSEEKYPSVKAVVDYVDKDSINAEITDIKEDLYKYHRDYKPLFDQTINYGIVTYGQQIISGNTYRVFNNSDSTNAKISVSVENAEGSTVILPGFPKGQIDIISNVTGNLKIYSDSNNVPVIIENINDISYKVNSIESEVENINTTISEINKVTNVNLEELTVNGYISAITGNIITNTGFIASDFIPINQNCNVSGIAISNGNYAICAFYDKSQNYILNSAYAPVVDDYEKFSVNAPTAAAFVRISIIKKNTFSVFKLSEKINQTVDELKNTVDELSEKISVVDDSKTLDIIGFGFGGYLSATTGNLITNTGFVSSDFIEIKSGTAITGTGKSNGNYAIYAFYDGSKSYISNSAYAPVVDDYTEYSANIPNNAKYVRFSALKTATETKANITWTIEDSLNEMTEKISSIQSSKEFYVGYGINDNNKYFESLVDCMYKAQEFNGHKIIHVQNGEYDVLEELGGMEYILSKNTTDDTFQAVQPYLNDVEIIGHGNVKLTFNIDDNTPRENYWLFAPLTVAGNVKIENIEIYAKNCRYCIHDESSNDFPNTKHEYINVRCYKSGDGGQASGNGFSANSSVYVDNCLFDTKDFMATWTCHAKDGCQFVFNNSIFRNVAALGSTAVRISETGIGQKLKAEFANCFITTGIAIREEASNPNAQGDTKINLINTHVSVVNNGYTIVNEPVISYNTIEGTETILVSPTA